MSNIKLLLTVVCLILAVALSSFLAPEKTATISKIEIKGKIMKIYLNQTPKPLIVFKIVPLKKSDKISYVAKINNNEMIAEKITLLSRSQTSPKHSQ